MFALFDETDATFGFVGQLGETYSNVAQALEMNDMRLDYPIRFSQLKETRTQRAQKWNFLFVDVDGLGGVNKMYDDLAAHRLRCPDQPVILLSSDFVVDDFDTARCVLADISLRTPVRYASLELALFQATQNNKFWQANVHKHQANAVA